MDAQKNCQKRILETLAYYDALDYPLTSFEVFRQMLSFNPSDESYDLAQTVENLETLQKQQSIVCSDGFWTLAKRQALVPLRLSKQKISLQKIKKMKKWIRLIVQIPFVRGLVVNGTLGMKRAGLKSDWDLQIIFSKNRIWLGRLLVILFLFLVGKKRTAQKTRDRFCLNHFLTQDGLALKEQNLFSASEMAFSFALYGKSLHRRMLEINQAWMRKYKINFVADEIEGGLLLVKDTQHLAIKYFFEKFLQKTGLAEKLNFLAKKFMIKKIKSNPLTHLVGADIRYDDQALIFLPKPQRQKVFQTAQTRMKRWYN